MKLKLIVIILLVQCCVLVAFGIQDVETTTLLNESYNNREIYLTSSYRYFYSSLKLYVKTNLYEEEFDLDINTYQNVNCQSYWIDDSHMYLPITSADEQKVDYVLDFSSFFGSVRLLTYNQYQKNVKEPINDNSTNETDKIPENKNPETLIDTEVSDYPSVYFMHSIKSYDDLQEVQNEIPSKDSDTRFYDERVYRYATGETMDLQILAGEVQITQDQGNSWIDVPINGGRLVDYWLSDLRIGDKSFYCQNDMIMVAYRINYHMLHLVVSSDFGKTWNDICFDVADKVGFSECQIVQNGEQYVLMLDGDNFGFSNDGLDWEFY